MTDLDDSERQPCECWTRVMGYHRPVTEWNIGKKAEHATRKFFTEAKAKSHVDTPPQPMAQDISESAS